MSPSMIAFALSQCQIVLFRVSQCLWVQPTSSGGRVLDTLSEQA